MTKFLVKFAARIIMISLSKLILLRALSAFIVSALVSTATLAGELIETPSTEGYRLIERRGGGVPLYLAPGGKVYSLEPDQNNFTLRFTGVQLPASSNATQSMVEEDTLYVFAEGSTERLLDQLLNDTEKQFEDGKTLVIPTAEANTDTRTNGHVLHRIDLKSMDFSTLLLQGVIIRPNLAVKADGNILIADSYSNIITTWRTGAGDAMELNRVIVPTVAAGLGIETRLPGVGAISTAMNDRILLASNREASLVEIYVLADPKTSAPPTRLQTLNGPFSGSFDFFLREDRSILVAVETYIDPVEGLSAILMVNHYDIDIAERRLDISTALDDFPIGRLFDLQALQNSDLEAQYANSVVEIAPDDKGERFALFSTLSNKVAVFRLTKSYVERINHITAPGRVRSSAFIGDTGILSIETTQGIFLYDNVDEWDDRNLFAQGNNDVRKKQRRLANAISVLSQTSTSLMEEKRRMPKLFMVDGHDGELTRSMSDIYSDLSNLNASEDWLLNNEPSTSVKNNISLSLNEELTPTNMRNSIKSKLESSELGVSLREYSFVPYNLDSSISMLAYLDNTSKHSCPLTSRTSVALKLVLQQTKIAPIFCKNVETQIKDTPIVLEFYTLRGGDLIQAGIPYNDRLLVTCDQFLAYTKSNLRFILDAKRSKITGIENIFVRRVATELIKDYGKEAGC